jgi:MoxR-like ATPase
MSEHAHAVGAALVDAVGKVVLGRPDVVRLAVAGVLSGGHLLVEDRPGVGKTLLGKALAAAIGGTFGRVQGTADLLPTDITGVHVLERDPVGVGTAWRFHPGPLFHHVVLVDELNRATPRAQSALLEAMAERQITVDGVTHALARPTVVIATQNPFGDAGTYPLVAGQLDRFTLALPLGLLDHASERDLLLGVGGERALTEAHPVTDPAGLQRAIDDTAAVHVAPMVADYVVHLAQATRDHPAVALGASPRGSLAVLGVARALALLDGRTYAMPDDVQAAALAALAHRLQTRDGLPATAVGAVHDVVASVPVPVG